MAKLPIGHIYELKVGSEIAAVLESQYIALTSGNRKLVISNPRFTVRPSNSVSDAHGTNVSIQRPNVPGASPIIMPTQSMKTPSFRCSSCNEPFSTALLFRNHSKSAIHGLNVRRLSKGLPALSSSCLSWAGEDEDRLMSLETEASVNFLATTTLSTDSNSTSSKRNDIEQIGMTVNASSKEELQALLKSQTTSHPDSSTLPAATSQEELGDEADLYTTPYYTFSSADGKKSVSLLRTLVLGRQQRFPVNNEEGEAVLRTLENYLPHSLRSGVAKAASKTGRKSLTLLCMGGRFSACVFEGEKVVAHTSFQNYTVRRKQGGSQSSHDEKGRAAQSVGATIRRQQQVRFRERIHETLFSWRHHIQESSAIFLFAPSANNAHFFMSPEEAAKWASTGGSNDLMKKKEPFHPPFHPLSKQCTPATTHLYLLHKDDERVRNIPLTVKPPTHAECLKVYNEITTVYNHDPSIASKSIGKESTKTEDDDSLSFPDPNDLDRDESNDPESTIIDECVIFAIAVFFSKIDTTHLLRSVEAFIPISSNPPKHFVECLTSMKNVVTFWRSRQEQLEQTELNSDLVSNSQTPSSDSEEEMLLLRALLLACLLCSDFELGNLASQLSTKLYGEDDKEFLEKISTTVTAFIAYSNDAMSGWNFPITETTSSSGFDGIRRDPVIVLFKAALVGIICSDPTQVDEDNKFASSLSLLKQIDIPLSMTWASASGRTPLHILSFDLSSLESTGQAAVAQNAASQILFPLIEAGGDILIKDQYGLLFTDCLKDAANIRFELRKFAFQYSLPEWHSVGVVPLDENALAEKLEKEKQRKKQLRAKNEAKKKALKQKQRTQQEEEDNALEESERQEEAMEALRAKELFQREEYRQIELKQHQKVSQLNDREKRLLALEARLKTPSAVCKLSTCEHCRKAILSVPFERMEYKYCSMDCLKNHKKMLEM